MAFRLINGIINANILKTKPKFLSVPKIISLSKSEPKKSIKNDRREAKIVKIAVVENNSFISLSLFLNSETYLTKPLNVPSIENCSKKLMTFFKFPTSAMPSAPIKMANTFCVINEKIILIEIYK